MKSPTPVTVRKPFYQNKQAPRLAIAGTSNGVLKNGYSYGLKDNPYYTSVSNLSIGFCSSDLFSYIANSTDFSQFDICLLDFSCNDASLLSGGFITEEHIGETIKHAVSQVSSAGCIPIILILPIEGYLPDGGKIVNIYFKIAAELGVLFFDGYKFLKLLRNKEIESIPAKFLFRDYMHLKEEVARGLSLCLTSSLKNIFAQNPEFVWADTAGALHKFFQISEALPQKEKTVNRATSLVSVDVFDFKDKSCWDISFPAEWEIVAFAADFAHCNGALSLAGKTNVRIQLAGDLYIGNEKALAFGIWPLASPIEVCNGTIRLNILGDVPVDYVANVQYKKYISSHPRIALIGFTARQSGHILPYLRYPGAVLDLCSFIGSNELELIKTEIKSAIS